MSRSPDAVEPKGSECSQNPVNRPDPEPNKSSAHHKILKLNTHNILPPEPKFPLSSFSPDCVYI
jgi:hypothetical protein